MDFLVDALKNQFLITGISSWLIAQIIKMIINIVSHNGFSIKTLFADGGMPSGHSATVSSLATATGLLCGTGSFQFAVTAILTIIICNDAAGVRFETGQQSILLNRIVKIIEGTEDLPEIKLKELVGHTKLQVFFGIVLGIANGFFMHYVVFPQIL